MLLAIRSVLAILVAWSFAIRPATAVAQSTGRIVGTAACARPTLTNLPGAQVDVFTGTAQVFETLADNTAGYSINGAAPNATYTIRYTSPPGAATPTCSVSVTTDANGSATAPTSTTHGNVLATALTSPTCLGGNRSWNAASPIASDPAGVEVSDLICEPAQSRWYEVEVQPGQHVTAEIDTPPFDVSLGLFKDIAAAAEDLQDMQSNGLALSDVQHVTASVPRDLAAPDATSPDATSPDATSPDATSPDATSPDATSPDATSPDATSPDATSPDATSPDATSPDPSITEATYLAAQSATLLAYSDKPGLAPEFVERHTWDNSGHFFIRVRGHNGASDDTHPFTLKITVQNVDCNQSGSAEQLVGTPASTLANLPPTPRTLILTDTGRFDRGEDVKGLLDALQQFAARPEVGGYVLDLKNDAGLTSDYTQWDSHLSCVPAANIVASQIHAIEAKLNSNSPDTLKYVVLVGNDRVIPFQRIPDQAGLGNERDYNPAVKEDSASQASLKSGYFLSQDLYGSFSQVSLGDHAFALFDVPVGRLVEKVTDIEMMLNAYETTNGVIEPSTALVTGYDFLSPAATREFDDLHDSGVTVDPLIEPDDEAPKGAKAWNADALRQPLLQWSKHYDILELNAHFSGNTLLAADDTTRIRSREVADVTDHRFFNTLVMSMGCHSGYNIVDPDATDPTPKQDWAQAFASQGATLVGGTGYQYGNSPFIKYSTQLLSDLTFHLRLYDGAQPGPVPLGDAILDVKQNYVRGGLNRIDEKAVSELSLYGLPMTKVNLREGRVRSTQGPEGPHTQPGPGAGLIFADMTPDYTLEEHHLDLPVVDTSGNTTGSTRESYFVANYAGRDGPVRGDVETNPGALVLPRVLTDVKVPDTLARGVILKSARYTDVTQSDSGNGPFQPLVDDAAVTERRGVRPAFASSAFQPTQIVSLNDIEGETLVTRPLQFESAPNNSVRGTGRRYDSVTARVYYSNRTDSSALIGPPIIYATSLTQERTRLLVDVEVGAATKSDLADVFATFTSNQTPGGNRLHGRWDSLALKGDKTVPDPNGHGFVRHYTGRIETAGTGATVDDLNVFIQAVGGNGLVTTQTNNGQLFKLADFPQIGAHVVRLSAPKLATSLSLQQAPGVPLGAVYRSTLHVSAVLTESLSQIPVANRTVTFSFGSALLHTTTGADGVASADFPVLLTSAGPLAIAASFVEDDRLLSSNDRRDVTVTPAATAFLPGPSSVAVRGSALIATLVRAAETSTQEPLGHVPVTIRLSNGRMLPAQTDVFGRVLFDTLDFDSPPPGTYTVTLTYTPLPGDVRYAPSTTSFTLTVTPAG